MSFDIVCFDCDSTLSRIEGIDELARRVGIGDEMAKLTAQAMDGEVPLEAVYERRLSLIKPDKSAIEWLADLYIQEMVDGAVQVFKVLQQRGKQLHIISGGLRQAIIPLAEKLGLAETHIHAVDVLFNADGSYRGFDTASPLARNGGKAEVCKQLGNNDASLIMIGDGQTDLESQLAGAYFVGFGGVVFRENVCAQADYYIRETSLLPLIEKVI